MFYSDGPQKARVDRQGDNLVCSAQCNPQCTYGWIYTVNGLGVTTGQRFTPNNTHTAADMECVVTSTVDGGESATARLQKEQSKY